MKIRKRNKLIGTKTWNVGVFLVLMFLVHLWHFH